MAKNNRDVSEASSSPDILPYSNFFQSELLSRERIGALNDDHHYLKDNEYILTGYRLYFDSSRKILKSLFQWHNESFNIWSHLIGFIIFVAILIYCAAFLSITSDISLISDDLIKYASSKFEGLKNTIDSEPFDWIVPLRSGNSLHKVSRWPLLVFIISAMICLSLSSVYHLFNAHSLKIYQLTSRLDYAGISLLICGSFFPPIYYMYYCSEGLIILYLVAISVFSAIVFVVALMEKFQEPKYRWFRGGIFLVLGLSGIVPCVNLAFENDTGEFADGLYCYLCMALCYIIGVLIYIFRLPERFLPGKLDTVGNSHNIWHLFVLAACVFHYLGAIDNYYSRSRILCKN